MSRKAKSVTPEVTFRELWRSLFKSHMNAVPVIDKQGKLVGIIAKEDLLERLYPDYHEIFLEELELADFEEMENKILELVNLTARDVMNKQVIFTRVETPIMRALSRMIVRRVSQLPVLDDKGALVGMVTKGDVFYSMFKTHLKDSTTVMPDEKKVAPAKKTAKKTAKKSRKKSRSSKK